MNLTEGLHYNYDFEKAVLGVCMLERGSFGRIYSMLDKDCFYHFGHQLVFSTIREMFVTGLPIDAITVVDQLVRVQKITDIGGENTAYFVIKITNDVVNGSHLEYHSAVLKTLWMERAVINLTHGGVEVDGDVRSKIYGLQQKLHSIQLQSIDNDWTDMSSLMVQLYQHQDEMQKTKGVGFPIGMPSIDTENGGFHRGMSIIIGARPSVGKSALAGGIAMNMASKGFKVGIISLEMSNVEIAARLASLDTNTDFKVLHRGLYRDEIESHKVYQRISDHTSTLPIFVSDKTDVSVNDIRAKAEKLKAKEGLDCLMIDYLQLIDAPEGYNKTRENEIAKISRGCKIMAKEMDIPVVLLCQLNREVTKRRGKERYPELSDLRESGSLEQDADVVMFLHRDWMAGFEQDENGRSTENQADLVVRKWRNGKTNFIIPLKFAPTQMKFEERNGGLHEISVSQPAYNTNDDNPF